MSELKPHAHANLIAIYAGQLARGELAAGWWLWETCIERDIEREIWTMICGVPYWHSTSKYRYSKTEKHPDNRKLKLVDMAKLPVGAKVNVCCVPHYFLGIDAYGHALMRRVEENRLGGAMVETLRILPSDWIGTPEGCDTYPMPDGLTYEVMFRDDRIDALGLGFRWRHDRLQDKMLRPNDIIFYRITGLADGWTDDPEKAK